MTENFKFYAELDNLEKVHYVGDGTYLDFTDKYVEIRKSGTDAKMKCYSDGENIDDCTTYAKAFVVYDGKLTTKFKEYISMELYKKATQTGMDLLHKYQKSV